MGQARLCTENVYSRSKASSCQCLYYCSFAALSPRSATLFTTTDTLLTLGGRATMFTRYVAHGEYIFACNDLANLCIRAQLRSGAATKLRTTSTVTQSSGWHNRLLRSTHLETAIMILNYVIEILIGCMCAASQVPQHVDICLTCQPGLLLCVLLTLASILCGF